MSASSESEKGREQEEEEEEEEAWEEAFTARLACGAVAEWAVRKYVLTLRSAFGTSHSSSTHRVNALLRVRLVRRDEGRWAGWGEGGGAGFDAAAAVGHGEVGLPPKKPGCYEAEFEDVLRFVAEMRGEMGAAAGDDGDGDNGPEAPFAALLGSRGPGHQAMRELLGAVDRTAARLAGRRSTKAALCGAEMAVLDAWCRGAGVAVHEAAAGAGGRRARRAPARSFYTVALNDSLDEMLESARFGLRHTPLLKVKLDADAERGRRILAAVAAVQDEVLGAGAGLLSVDANAAWSPDTALRFLDEVLAPLGRRLYMVEQPFPLFRADGRGGVCAFSGGDTPAAPVPAATLDAWRRVREAYGARGVLVYGDESVGGRADVEALRGIMHGCNVKLEKAGGLRGALDAMAAAAEHGLEVWVGIMVASSLNTSAAAAILQLASSGYGDVDGDLLLTDACQAFEGGYRWGEGGQIGMVAAAGAPGLGTRLK